MKRVLRAFLIASAATAAAAAVATLFRRPALVPHSDAPNDPFYVEADAMTDAERQALRSELEGMI
ncbi:MAG: hypothetical protein R2834_17845 [Rhodothermales bacterium]